MIRRAMLAAALLAIFSVRSDAQNAPRFLCGGTSCPASLVSVAGGCCSCSGGTLTLTCGGGGVTSVTGGQGITATPTTGAVVLGSACGGDLAGTVSSATVGAIQNRTVSNAAPVAGNPLVYDGAEWAPGGNVLLNNNASALYSANGTSWQAESGSTGAVAGFVLKACAACTFNSAVTPVLQIDDANPVLDLFAVTGESGIKFSQGGSALAGIAATTDTIVLVDHLLGSNVTITTGADNVGSVGSSATHFATAFANRISMKGDTVLTTDWAISAGWGATASVTSVAGVDAQGSVTITASGGSFGANPTAKLTFRHGTWGTAPSCQSKQQAGNLGTVVNITDATTPTDYTITFNSTPIATIYTLSYHCFGTN